MNKHNPVTKLKEKYNDQEIVELVQITFLEIRSFGIFPLFFRIKHFIKPFLFWSSIVCLIFIMFGNADLWTFFIPLIPVVLFLILFLIDFVKVQFSLIRAQERLQKLSEKKISWDDMIYLSVIVLTMAKVSYDDDEDNFDKPTL